MRTALRAAALVIVLGLVGLAVAQPAPRNEDKEPDKTKEVSKPLTHKTLLDALKQLGHDPQVFGDNKNVYRLTVELPSFHSVFDVSLSQDEKVLWICTYSRVLPDLDAIPADVLLDLLRANADADPAHFSLDAKARRVYLQMQLPNRAFGNADLRERIESFAALVKRNHHRWTYSKLQPPAAVEDDQASAKLRQKLLGEWVIESLTKDGNKMGADSFTGTVYRFSGTRLNYTNGPRMQTTLEQSGDRINLDMLIALGEKQPCLAELDGDTLTICLPAVNGKRPEKMTGEKSSGCSLMVLKRKK